MKGSARFRHKRAVADVVKTDEEDVKDHVTSRMKFSRICDLNAAPSNEGQQDEMVPMKGIKREIDQVSFQPSFKSLYVHGSSSNLKTEPADKLGDSPPSQQDSNHGPPTIEFEADGGFSSEGPEFLLRGCMRCYMYVLVRADHPRCPNCRKPDCLRDLCLDQKPVVNGNKMIKRDH